MNKEVYYKLHNEVKSRDYSKFYKKLEDDFKTTIPKEIHSFIHKLALPTQITIKPSKMLYLHGFVLYISLKSYILKYQQKQKQQIIKKNKPITIIETGTAKGFSSIIMAKTLQELNQEGTIHTIDIIAPNKPLIRNTINDLNKYPRTLYEILEPHPYKELYQKYIKFHYGDSKDIIPEIIKNSSNPRVNFAFLDAHHTYTNLTNELNLILPYQNPEDMIICDDYTIYLKQQNQQIYQYPGIIQALKEFIIKNPNYTNHIYYGNDGDKLRGYVVLQKNN